MQTNKFSPLIVSQLEHFQFFWLENSPIDYAKFVDAFCNEMMTDRGKWKFFNESELCRQDLDRIGPNRHVVLISSGRLLKEILNEIHSFVQLHSIYIFCFRQETYESLQWTHRKIRGVFKNPKEIKNALYINIRQDGFFRSTILATIDFDSLSIVPNIPMIPFLENRELKTFYQPNRIWSPWANDIWTIKLNRIGQGTIEIRQHRPIPFTLFLSENANLFDDAQENHIIRLDVDTKRTELRLIRTVQQPFEVFKRLFQKTDEILQTNEQMCHRYWLSFSGKEHMIRFGIGEVRPRFTTIHPHFSDEFKTWIERVQFIHFEIPSYIIQQESIENDLKIYLSDEPILFEPVPFIISPSEFSSTHSISYLGVFAPLLSNVHQHMYKTLQNFQLDNEQFPDLISTINESVKNPRRWCYKFLREKCNRPLGERLDSLSIQILIDLRVEYPCMIEIWPAGNHSSIRTCTDETFRLIRVLHGKLSMKFFPSLSLTSQHNLCSENLSEVNQILWMMPNLNQTYQITNPDNPSSCCISIQSYCPRINIDETTTIPVDIDWITFKERMRHERES